MSSTSSAAATLTRPRIAVAVVSAVAAASAGYYCFVQYRQPRPDTAAGGASLHRSNALRRSRRRSLLQDDLSDNDAPPGDENTALVPLGGTDGHTDDQDWYNDPSQSPRQRSGENIVTLLFRVSEDNARRNAYVHRGCQCNGCGMVPIRGIRYRCANCADFDLCEACESQSLHYRTHVFYKVRVPAPPFGPRQVQPAWYPGDPDTAPRTLPRHLLAKWSNETGFERVELDAFWEQWTFIANTEWRDDPTGLCLAMDRKTFERCLVPSGGYKHAAPNLIHDRMFAFYDTNNDDLIGFEEFLHGVSYRKRKDKLARTFEGYDIDGDGYVCRKDFLRMFRAYYVLYKQMHRDILEGLDDYMMSTTEAQQLVNGRAPLSSLFGREGRVPGGDHSRPQEGKVFRSNGEVDVHDGKGVVNKDKPDTAGREEILSGLFSRHNQSAFTESFGTTSRRARSPNNESSRYWTGLLNPPQNVAELTSLVNGEVNIDDILSSLRNQDSTSHALETQSASSDDQERPTPAENADSDMMNSLNTARYARRSDTNRFTTTLAPEGQLRTQHHTTVGSSRLSQERRKRIQVRKQLLERWKRRQFYLDEEEGGLPPQGWKETEDILEDLTNAAGPSQEPQMLSSRSRSSSKVRFADDDDDLDTRSNPSTSSRSIPERWGGMEIPDAERDAGKEILYQVTQQAFNELLDDIFKRKEDLAVQCAQTKDERNKYRHLFENIQLEAVSTTPPDENAPRGNRPIQQQSLEELLTVSGYTVDPAALRARSPVEPASEDAGHNAPNNRDIETPAVQPATTTEPTNIDTPATYRDPTMPQFRPNTESDSVSTAPAQQDSTCSESSSLVAANVPRGQPTARTQSGDSSDSHAEPAHIPHSTLVTWKRLDVAEAEARARGGWGKLNFEEFEDIYREHELHENNRNRLDYLGSWIDFCIP